MNPYAPPAPAPQHVPQAVLPAGMRRYKLAREPYLALVRRIFFRRQVVVLAVMLAVVTGWLSLIGVASLLPMGIAAVVLSALVVVSWLRLRAQADRQLAMFEVVVSARVVRRAMPLLQPAEMLRPEVTRIVETRRALSLVSTTPRRTVSVARVIDGYDELRAQLATWGTIETLRGWSAFAFAWGQLRHARPRDRIEGALASDVTLLDELTAVRTVSGDQGGGFGPVFKPRRFLLLVLGLWILLVVMWLALWTFFGDTTVTPRPRTPPALSL
ncbi:MAG TPA: hypothetical protein VF765_38080 [Polyangiaceae bacterium]